MAEAPAGFVRDSGAPAPPAGFVREAVQGSDNFADTTEALARGMVRGIPIVGPALESGIEHVESLLPRGYGASGQPLDAIQARGAQLRAEHPIATTTGEITGSVAGGAAMMMTAPTLFGAGRGSLFTRMVLGGGSGAAVGAGDAEVRGGDPATGALYGAAGGAGGVLIGGMLGKAFAKRAAAPTSQALKAQAGPLFEQARAAGLTVKAEPYRDAVAKLAAVLDDRGIDELLTPKAARVLVRLQDAAKGDSIDLAELTKLRRLAGIAAGSTEPSEAAMGELMTEALDAFMVKLGPAQVNAENPAAANAILKEARGLWIRASRAEVIESALDRAELAVGGGQAKATALKTQFRQLARNQKQMRRFSKAEQSAIRAVAAEDRIATLMAKVADLRNVIVGTGAGALGLGLPGGVAVGAGLLGVRAIGRGLAARSARQGAAVAQELASTGRLQALTPSARARAFGQAATFGAGLTVGRDYGAESEAK